MIMKTKLPHPLATLSLAGIAFALSGCDSAPTADPAATPATEASATATQIDHVDAAGAATQLASADKPKVIDVRTPEEFAEGHIEGATLIDFKSPDFESKLGELDRDQTYLIHCRSGARSTSSLPTFEKLGFKHVIHLDGGFNAWQEAGQAVTQ